MIYLKYFKLFEAVIIPPKLDHGQSRFNSYDDVVNFGRENDFDVVGYDKFYSSLSDVDKKTAPPNLREVPFFALFHPQNKRAMFVLCDSNFWRIPIFKEILSDVIGHEMIHKEQVGKMGKIGYILPNPKDTGKYLSDKMEVMAFSWTIANAIRRESKSYQQAVEIFRNLQKKSPRSIGKLVGDIYNLDEKTIKRYNKYIYMYLDNFYEGQDKSISPKKQNMEVVSDISHKPTSDNVVATDFTSAFHKLKELKSMGIEHDKFIDKLDVLLDELSNIPNRSSKMDIIGRELRVMYDKWREYDDVKRRGR
jgi:hypothetical protein